MPQIVKSASTLEFIANDHGAGVRLDLVVDGWRAERRLRVR
jgi:hypothetical protein